MYFVTKLKSNTQLTVFSTYIFSMFVTKPKLNATYHTFIEWKQKNNSLMKEKPWIIIYQHCDSFQGFSAILIVKYSGKTAKIFHRYSLSRKLFESFRRLRDYLWGLFYMQIEICILHTCILYVLIP